MMTPPLSSSLTSIEAIRKNNARTERKFIARQQKRSKQARADAPRVAALRRAFAVRAKTQARAVLAAALAATEAVRAAAEAARALQALDDEMREATRMAIGNDYADWHPDGLGGVFVALAARIVGAQKEGGTERIVDDAARIVDDAARIAEGAEAFAALASSSAEANADDNDDAEANDDNDNDNNDNDDDALDNNNSSSSSDDDDDDYAPAYASNNDDDDFDDFVPLSGALARHVAFR